MEILQYAVSNGMIDTESLQKSIEMKKKEEYLKKHQYACLLYTSDAADD